MLEFLRRAKRALADWMARRRTAREATRGFAYDREQFMRSSGALHLDRESAARAEIVMGYHVLEKGLTMPRRRLGFGRGAVLRLVGLVTCFERRFGLKDPQVRHAVAVLRAYRDLHAQQGPASGETGPDHRASFEMPELDAFLARFPDVAAAKEPHVRRVDFFAAKEAPFPQFAASRHVCRHFSGAVPRERIEAAVALAANAPSACNRQYSRVHVIGDAATRDRLFAMQGGARGFGSDADKVLVVTADLSAVRWGWERHDCWVNGGIFVMNLCYALHYNGVAHCILHWSVPPEVDSEAHQLLGVPANEAIVSVVACGMPPEEFDVAASPRLAVDDIISWKSAGAADLA